MSELIEQTDVPLDAEAWLYAWPALWQAGQSASGPVSQVRA